MKPATDNNKRSEKQLAWNNQRYNNFDISGNNWVTYNIYKSEHLGIEITIWNCPSLIVENHCHDASWEVKDI